MIWVNLLHFYQPIDQEQSFIEAVTRKSYLPLLRSIAKTLPVRGGSMTLNINATLLKLWHDHGGYGEVLDLIRDLLSRGVIELTATGMYHPFMPLLPAEEIRRQIELNSIVSKNVLGDLYQPNGFFPPELGYSNQVGRLAAQSGLDWIVLDEVAHDGSLHKKPLVKPHRSEHYPELKIVFTQRAPSFLGIMQGVLLDAESFRRRADRFLTDSKFLITATDGEIYGYYRPGQEEGFSDLIGMTEVECWSYSRFCHEVKAAQISNPLNSSWNTTPQERKQDFVYPFWYNAEGEIHPNLKDLLYLAIRTVGKNSPHGFSRTRDLLDQVETSDTFWWSSQYKLWWSLPIVENGARLMRDIVQQTSGATDAQLQKADKLYRRIVLAAVEWNSSQERVKVARHDYRRTANFEKKLAALF